MIVNWLKALMALGCLLKRNGSLPLEVEKITNMRVVITLIRLLGIVITQKVNIQWVRRKLMAMVCMTVQATLRSGVQTTMRIQVNTCPGRLSVRSVVVVGSSAPTAARCLSATGTLLTCATATSVFVSPGHLNNCPLTLGSICLAS